MPVCGSDNPRRIQLFTLYARFHARASATAPGKTERIATTAAHIVAMAAATPQERAAAAVPALRRGADNEQWCCCQLAATAASRLRAPICKHSQRFTCSAPLSHQQVQFEVLFGARRRVRARRRTICSPERCSARVEVGEGAGARGLQSGVVAMCSSARVGVGEGAEACSSINSERPGALLGRSVAFGSGCG